MNKRIYTKDNILQITKSNKLFRFSCLFVITFLTLHSAQSFVLLSCKTKYEEKIMQGTRQQSITYLSFYHQSQGQIYDAFCKSFPFNGNSRHHAYKRETESRTNECSMSSQLNHSTIFLTTLYQFLPILCLSFGIFSKESIIANAADAKNLQVKIIQPLEKLPSLPDPAAASTTSIGNGEVSLQRGYQNQMSQIEEAMPLKSIRGIWRIREYRQEKIGTSRNSQTYLYKGRLKFQGFVDEPLKGKLVYKRVPKYSSSTASTSFASSSVAQASSTSAVLKVTEGKNNIEITSNNKNNNDDKDKDNDKDINENIVTGKGNWLLKPARIVNGQIQFSARWKVKYTDGTTLIYRGDVRSFSDSKSEDTNYSKAFASITDGEILEPYKDAFGGLTERKIGYFEADLIEKIDDEEKL